MNANIDQEFSKVGLFHHNAEAYRKVKKAFDSGNDRACIVHATGTGKSYVSLQLALDNKDKKILYIVPSKPIKDHVNEIINNNPNLTEEDFKNLEFMTYQGLIKLQKEDIEKMQVDLIILDEFHHVGAPIWGNSIDRLINSHPGVKVFGMSAYPIRNNNSNKERDMTGKGEMFYNSVVSSYSLAEAIVDGVLPMPEYYFGHTNLIEELNKTKEYIKKIDYLSNHDKKLLKKCETAEKEAKYEESLTKLIRTAENQAKRLVQGAENADTNLINNTKLTGKYIYFCPGGVTSIDDDNENIRLIDAQIELVKKDLKDNGIDENDYVIYKTTSLDKDGKANRDAFYNDKALDGRDASGKLRIMFCVNQYNEGVHAPNVDGVILGRSTMSDVVFFEQIGRALNVSKDEKQPKILDFSGNYEFFAGLTDEIRHISNEKVKKGKPVNKRVLKLCNSRYNINLDDVSHNFMKTLNQLTKEYNSKTINIINHVRAIEAYCVEFEQWPKYGSSNNKVLNYTGDKLYQWLNYSGYNKGKYKYKDIKVGGISSKKILDNAKIKIYEKSVNKYVKLIEKYFNIYKIWPEKGENFAAVYDQNRFDGDSLAQWLEDSGYLNNAYKYEKIKTDSGVSTKKILDRIKRENEKTCIINYVHAIEEYENKYHVWPKNDDNYLIRFNFKNYTSNDLAQWLEDSGFNSYKYKYDDIIIDNQSSKTILEHTQTKAKKDMVNDYISAIYNFLERYLVWPEKNNNQYIKTEIRTYTGNDLATWLEDSGYNTNEYKYKDILYNESPSKETLDFYHDELKNAIIRDYVYVIRDYVKTKKKWPEFGDTTDIYVYKRKYTGDMLATWLEDSGYNNNKYKYENILIDDNEAELTTKEHLDNSKLLLKKLEIPNYIYAIKMYCKKYHQWPAIGKQEIVKIGKDEYTGDMLATWLEDSGYNNKYKYEEVIIGDKSSKDFLDDLKLKLENCIINDYIYYITMYSKIYRKWPQLGDTDIISSNYGINTSYTKKYTGDKLATWLEDSGYNNGNFKYGDILRNKIDQAKQYLNDYDNQIKQVSILNFSIAVKDFINKYYDDPKEDDQRIIQSNSKNYTGNQLYKWLKESKYNTNLFEYNEYKINGVLIKNIIDKAFESIEINQEKVKCYVEAVQDYCKKYNEWPSDNKNIKTNYNKRVNQENSVYDGHELNHWLYKSQYGSDYLYESIEINGISTKIILDEEEKRIQKNQELKKQQLEKEERINYVAAVKKFCEIHHDWPKNNGGIKKVNGYKYSEKDLALWLEKLGYGLDNAANFTNDNLTMEDKLIKSILDELYITYKLINVKNPSTIKKLNEVIKLYGVDINIDDLSNVTLNELKIKMSILDLNKINILNDDGSLNEIFSMTEESIIEKYGISIKSYLEKINEITKPKPKDRYAVKNENSVILRVQALEKYCKSHHVWPTEKVHDKNDVYEPLALLNWLSMSQYNNGNYIYSDVKIDGISTKDIIDDLYITYKLPSTRSGVYKQKIAEVVDAYGLNKKEIDDITLIELKVKMAILNINQISFYNADASLNEIFYMNEEAVLEKYGISVKKYIDKINNEVMKYVSR